MSNLESLGNQIDQICDRFEACWRGNHPPEIADYLQADNFDHSDPEARKQLLTELVLIDLEHRLARGEDASVEAYLNEFPELIDGDGEAPARLVAEEQSLRKLVASRIAQSNRVPVMQRSGSVDDPQGSPVDDAQGPAIPSGEETCFADAGQTGDGSGQTMGASPYDDQAPVTDVNLPIGYVDDYVLIEKIAQGGMGVVYKARDTGLKCDVALKMIRSGEFAGSEEIERFHREAEAAARLQHPGIVRIHRIGESSGRHYFTMDLVDGQSLTQLVDAKPLSEKEAVQFAIEICDAVEYAHQHGILHRDIKPSNVLIDSSGRALVTDFGLAKSVGEDSDFSRTGQALGTPGYMPPEQAIGQKERISYQSDVYSIGALLYHLLTGHPPFEGQSHAEIIAKVLNTEPVPPQKVNRYVARDLNTICMKCLEKEPAKRYVSAAALRDELRSFSQGFPIQARPVTSAERVWRWCRRNKLVASLLLAVFITLSIAAPVTWLSTSRYTADLQIRLVDAKRNLESEIGSLRKQHDLFNGVLSEHHELLDDSSQKLDEALQAYETAYAQWREYHREDAQNEELLFDSAEGKYLVADACRLLGKFPESAASFADSVERFGRLAKMNPTVVTYHKSQGKALNSLGEMYRERGDLGDDAQAESSYQASRAALEIAFGIDETDFDTRYELARTYNNRGLMLRAQGRETDAHECYEKSTKLARKLLTENPDDDQCLLALVRPLINGGQLHLDKAEVDDAIGDWQEAIEELENAVAKHPENSHFRHYLAVSQMNLGFARVKMEDLNAAIRSLTSALETYQELAKGVPKYRLEVAVCQTNLMMCYWRSQDMKKCKEFQAKALAEISKLLDEYPDGADHLSWMGVILGNDGAIAENDGETDKAIKQIGLAIGYQSRALQKQPTNRDYRQRLFKHHHYMTQLLLRYRSALDPLANQQALDHLLKAIDLGYADVAELTNDNLYEPISEIDAFKAAVQRLKSAKEPQSASPDLQ